MHQVIADGFHYAADNVCGLEILAKEGKGKFSLIRTTQVMGKKACLYKLKKTL